MMKRMKSIVLLAAGAAVAMGFLEAATQPTEETKALYVRLCQACHGPDGKALLPDMSFFGREWKHGTKTPDMVKVITDGVPGTMMMPFKGRLTEAQIRDLARYVRSLDPTLRPEKK